MLYTRAKCFFKSYANSLIYNDFTIAKEKINQNQHGLYIWRTQRYSLVLTLQIFFAQSKVKIAQCVIDEGVNYNGFQFLLDDDSWLDEKLVCGS